MNAEIFNFKTKGVKGGNIIVCKCVMFLQSKNVTTSNKWRIRKTKIENMSLIFTQIIDRSQRISFKA